MTIPSAATKAHLDSGTDDPRQARAELAELVDKFNTLRSHLATSGITSGSSVLGIGTGLESAGGNLRLSDSEVSAGSYTAANITVDAKGRVTAASDGAAPVFESALFHVRDEKAEGAAGGTFSSGAWRTRTLNTVVTSEIAGASLSADTITMPAGTYYVEGEAPAFGVNDHKARLLDSTHGVVVARGPHARANPSDADVTFAFIRGRFTLAEESDLILQHRCATSGTNTGFGVAAGFSEAEVYSDVRLWKIA